MLRAFTYGIANQLVSSGTTFLLSTYMLVFSTPTEFGLFSFALAIATLVAGAGNALLITQMVVHLPRKHEAQAKQYCANILIFIIVCCVLHLLVGVLIWMIFSLFEWHDGRIIMSIACLSSVILLRDFFVRHAYSISAPVYALILNIIIAVALAFFLTLLHLLSNKALAIQTIYVWSAAGALAALVFYFGLYYPYLARPNRRTLSSDVIEAWHGGRFAFLSHGVISLRSQVHLFIVSGMLGLEAFGHLNAVRLFFSPILVIYPSLVQIYLPKIAVTMIDNVNEAYLLTKHFTIFLLCGALAYAAILLCGYDYISSILQARGYTGSLLIIVSWCLFCIAMVARSGTELLIIAARRFKLQMTVNIMGAVISLAMAIILVSATGSAGAIFAIVLSEVYVIYRMAKKNVEIRNRVDHTGERDTIEVVNRVA